MTSNTNKKKVLKLNGKGVLTVSGEKKGEKMQYKTVKMFGDWHAQLHNSKGGDQKKKRGGVGGKKKTEGANRTQGKRFGGWGVWESTYRKGRVKNPGAGEQ